MKRRERILCPSCFIEIWAERTGFGKSMIWELRLHLPANTETPT